MNSSITFQASALVALGGALGAWLRFATTQAWAAILGPARAAAFPWATLTANMLGSIAMGVLVGWLARQGGGEAWRLLLGVGVLGGFTTFSSFALEVVMLAQRGAMGSAVLYVAVSLVGGLAGLFGALMLMRGAS
ncbi:fluoride efflux transporter CrcB [Novosphingobium sp. Chol11]|uniref:fluoride efflux transporter CrcB n=1 Tax=Novosphingobium sp. Chol11 TaxID=1385763 RepID=UPI0025E91F76|nr:fluoride efflux transporter CrcB [Novosphingobium sp. Chol11]